MKPFDKLRGFSFNTQPPEGGWVCAQFQEKAKRIVSTHSRLKAAGYLKASFGGFQLVSTHSRLKAAGFGPTMRSKSD